MTIVDAASLDYNPTKFGLETLLFRKDSKKLFVNTGTYDTPVYTEIIAGLSDNKFTAEAQQWNPISGLSAEKIQLLTLDMTRATRGGLRAIIDGVKQPQIRSGNLENKFYLPSTSLSVIADGADLLGEVATTPDKIGDISAEDTNMGSACFSQDGLHMYATGTVNDRIYEYSLSIAWDPSTRTYTTRFKSILSEDVSPSGCAIKDDGTKFFLMGEDIDGIAEYALSTAYEIDSATLTDETLLGAATASRKGLHFKADGTIAYWINVTNDTIEQASGTAWDASTFTMDSTTGITAPQGDEGLWISADGKILYLCDNAALSVIRSFPLSTPFDSSTFGSLLESKTMDVPADEFFMDDNGKYVFFLRSDDVRRYPSTLAGEAYASVQ